MAINFLNNIASIGTLTITKATTDPLLYLYNTTNGSGATIRFSDQTTPSQVGDITYFHSDGSSQGGGASFHFRSEPDTVVVAGGPSNTGRFVSKSKNDATEVDYGFYDDVNTGMYRAAADTVRLAGGGVYNLSVSATNAALYYQSGLRFQTTSSGAKVEGGLIIEGASDTMLTLNQTGTDTGWSYINFNTLGTRNYYVGQDSSKNFNIYNDNIDVVAISVSYANANTTLGADLIVGGGDITLSGTGRIQGVDTVSASTDAANKLYVDNAVAGVPIGNYLPLDGGTMTGDLKLNDNVDLYLGTGNDFQAYHDGSNTYLRNLTGDFYIRQDRVDASMIFQCDDGTGGLETYFQLEGASGGASPFTVFPDSSTLAFGTGHDFRLYHNNGGFIDNYTGVLQFTNYADDSDIVFRSDNGSGGTTAYLTLDGSTTHAYFSNPGNVGIGTTSPSTKLHVVGSAGEFALSLQNSSNGDGIKITTENQTANNGFLWNQGSSNLVNMYSSSTTNASKMIMLGGGVDKIFFNTEGNSYFNGGNVGIGTTSPGYKLSVSGNIGLTDGVSTGLLALVGGNYYIQNTGAYSTVFQTNGAERMRITSTGNVGIGTTSPSRPLSVYRSTAGSAANFLHYTDATAFAGLYIDVDNVNNIVELNASGDTASTMAFQTGNAERMRITTTGSVGIGTTSPDSFNSEARNLVVNGSGDVGISIATTTTTGNSSVVFADGTGGTAGYRGRLKYGHATDYMAFFTAAAERLRITSAGNVGIGTTSPDRPLSVVGGNSMVARFQSTNTTAFIQLSNTVSTADQVRIGSNGTNLVLSTNYAERMRITSAGAIKFNAYDSTNNTGTPTYLLGTDASGNVVKTLSTPSPITSQAASLYDLIPNGAFTTTYAFTSTAGTYAEVMSGDDVITAAGTYSVQMYVNDYAVGGTQYREYYSGVMSWNAPDSTNDTGIGAVSEIVLHRAGHAANSGITYLRTRETGSGENNELRLEIMCNKTYTGASNVVFKFVRLI